MTDRSETPYPDPSRTVLFRAHLTPYRSLSRRAFRRIMLVVCGFSLIVSTGLFLAGAWPAFGFLGLDILLVWLALRASYRSARVSETLELDETALTVERADRKGTRQWRLQPAWLRVELREPILPQTPVVLRSHGQTLGIGAFLSPDERRRVARELRQALDRWRRPGAFF
jgi:uncharacterized membrane protein